MAEAIAANEMNDQEHKQRAANHDGDGDLQTQLQVVEIRDLADHLGAKAAHQLRGKHVNADGRGVRSAGHHVMKNGGDGAVIPRHEKAGNEEAHEHELFLLGLDGEQ